MKRCIFAFAFLALSAMFAHALHTPAPSGLKAMAQR